MSTTKILAGTILLLSLALACNRQAQAPTTPATATQPAPPTVPATALAIGPVVETMNAGEYTYVRVKTDKGDIWAAAGQFPVKVGEKVMVPTDMPMADFRSPTLNRTFPLVYFTGRIFKEGDKDAPIIQR